ncbi:hypothetical protein ACH5RR_000861 [Cinchona calisaya]|uniref:Uncharacterized protein n=1 Tax=Cinchona calisaya TaxID=153742 RepID=A0ABD3B1U2_9GENT
MVHKTKYLLMLSENLKRSKLIPTKKDMGRQDRVYKNAYCTPPGSLLQASFPRSLFQAHPPGCPIQAFFSRSTLQAVLFKGPFRLTFSRTPLV